MNFSSLLLFGRFIPGSAAAFIALVLLPSLALGQQRGTVSGRVMDGGSGTPLKAATAVLRDMADSSAKALGDITGGDGRFSIRDVIAGRRYRLEVMYVGYEKHTAGDIVLPAGTENLDLGDVTLRQGAIPIDEVRVTAPREQVVVMADKTVYAVEDNPSYTATNVSELLGQIPSVDVDQEGKVSLRGDDNVTIMMNDRPLTMPAEQRNKFLQSLPANTVKDIEIRTNPGAQFDAKYSGGIINIVTRRTMGDMFGGNVSLAGDSRPGGNGSGGLYYNGSDVNASLGGGMNRGDYSGSSTTLRVNYLDSNEHRNEGRATNESVTNGYFGYGQLDYKITEKDLLSLSFNLNYWSSNYGSIGSNLFFNADGDEVIRSYDTSMPAGDGWNGGGYNSASLLMRHTFSPDHKINLDISYNGNNSEGGSNYRSMYYWADGTLDGDRSAGRYSTYDQSNATIISTLTYDNALSESFNLSLGGKSEINMLDNNTTVSNRDRITGEFVPDTLQSSHYLPDNAVYALYANASYRVFTDLSFQAGIRFERANISAEYASGVSLISLGYSNFFPSGSIAYNITPEHSLTFSYRRSVALPDIYALNPVRVKWNDFFEQSGNPDLDPEFTQTFELNYNTFWGAGNMISVAPYYSTTDGSIENSQQLIGSVNYSTYENFNGAYSIGSEMSLALRPLKWLNFRASANLYRKVNRGSDVPGDVYSAASGYSGNLSLSVDPVENLTFATTVFVMNPSVVGAVRAGNYTFMNFSLRQRMLENKLSISLRLNDPFNMQKARNEYDTPEFYSKSVYNRPSRYIGLNVSYNFGTTPRMETHKQEKSDTKGGSSGGAGGG